jgi:hypothetical protein
VDNVEDALDEYSKRYHSTVLHQDNSNLDAAEDAMNDQESDNVDDNCLVSLPGEDDGGEINDEIEDDESTAESDIGDQVKNINIIQSVQEHSNKRQKRAAVRTEKRKIMSVILIRYELYIFIKMIQVQP